MSTTRRVEDVLKIAMISYYLPSDSKIGVGYQVNALANAMQARGHDVTVFSPCPPVGDATYHHHPVQLSGSLRTFRFATTLARTDFSAFDVLHAHGDDYWMWRRRVQTHVRTLHGSCFEEALRIKGVKERTRMVALGLSEVLASVVADHTVAVSPRTRKWTPWVRSVIPNGVDTNHFRPDRAAKTGHPTVLFVGTWNGRKRGRDLARTFTADVRSQVPDAELWMVTRDAPPDPGPGIHVLGSVDDEELADLYARAWAFCLPSDYEGFGIPYAEAMASGTAVVATPNVGARYVTEEGASGIIAPLPEIGARLSSVLTSATRREDLVLAGLERSRAFSMDRVCEAYELLYRHRR